MTKTMRKGYNGTGSRGARVVCAILTLALMLSAMAALFAVLLPLNANAAEDGLSFTADDSYRQQQSIGALTQFTFEVEFYIDPAFSDTTRGGIFLTSWHPNENYRDGNEWGIELHQYGTVRFYHQSLCNLFFGINASTGENVTKTGSPHASNDGSIADVRTYTTDGKYVKIAVVFDSATGNFQLYINGNYVCDSASSTVSGEADTITGKFKGYTISTSTENPYHAIGGDTRSGNTEYFKGKIRNMALYGDVRTPTEILADCAEFSPSSSDANLRFAYDMTTVTGNTITDLSANGNNAMNGWVDYTGTPTERPTTTGNGDTIDADDPLIYVYIDKDNDGVAEYDSAWMDFNGNSGGDEGVFWKAHNLASTTAKIYAVLQNDFTQHSSRSRYNNMAYMTTEVLVDLNGYNISTLSSATGTATMLSAECKGSLDAQRSVKVSFFNSKDTGGKITIAGSLPLIYSTAWGDSYSAAYGTTDSNGTYNGQSGSYQLYSYKFHGITFDYAVGATAPNPLVFFENNSAGSTSTTKIASGIMCGLDIELNDCTFDMTNAPAGAVLFDAKDSSFAGSITEVTTGTAVVNSVVNMTVKGGEIICSDPTAFTFAENNYYTVNGVSIPSEVKFGKNGSGDYVKVTLPAGTEVPAPWTALASDDDADLGVFSNGTITPTSDAFTFANPLDTSSPTEYYLMPSVQYEGKGDYVLASAYYSKNFAVFLTTMDESGNDGDWEYLGGADLLFDDNVATNTVYGLLAPADSAYANLSVHSIISRQGYHNNHVAVVMTKDCTLNPTGKYNNFGQIRGKLTYDLGGYTLNWAASVRLINAEAKIGNSYGMTVLEDGSIDAKHFTDAQEDGLYHSTRFEMKNGTFMTKLSTLIVISAFGSTDGNHPNQQYHDFYEATGKAKLFDLNFSNLTIGMSEATTIDAFLIKHGADASTGEDAVMKNTPVNVDVAFSDCTFDLTNTGSIGTLESVATGKSRTLFNATDDTWNTYNSSTGEGIGNINSIVNITVNGGTVISDTAVTDFLIADCFNASDNTADSIKTDGTAKGASVTFNKGSDGRYLTVILPEGSTKPIVAVDGTTGAYLGDLNVESNNEDAPGTVGSLHVYRAYMNNLLTYTDNGMSAGGLKVFTLEPPRIENGDLDQNYAAMIPAYYYDDIESYPFFVFDTYTADYRCAGAYSKWGYAMQKIGTQDNSVILLRRNFNNTAAGDANSGALSNLTDGADSDSVGTAIIDLNGKTFTRSSTAYFIDLYYNTVNSCKKKYIIAKNGTLVNNYSWGPICLNYSTNLPERVGENVFAYTDFEFENVTFNATYDYNTKGVGSTPIFWMWEDAFDLLADTDSTDIDDDANPFVEKAKNATDRGFVKIGAILNNCNVSSVSYTPLALRTPDEYYKGESDWRAYRNRIIIDLTMNGGAITYKNGNIIERNLEAEEPLFADEVFSYHYSSNTYDIESSYTNYSTPDVDNTDNITFGKYDGNYPTLIIPTSATRPAQAFLASSGLYRGDLGDGVDLRGISSVGDSLLSFVGASVSGDNTTYEIAEADEYTVRTLARNPLDRTTDADGKMIYVHTGVEGTVTALVPAYYSDSRYASEAPFWVFEDGTLLLATSTYGDDSLDYSALHFATDELCLDVTSNTAVTVYVAADTVAGSKYSNLTYLWKPLMIDLGGHTVSVTDANCLAYRFHRTNRDNYEVMVANGSVELSKSGAVVIYSATAHADNGFTLESDVHTSYTTLKNLNVTVTSAHYLRGAVAYLHDVSATEPRTAPRLTVIDCAIDVTQDPIERVTVFETIELDGTTTSDPYDRIDLHVTVDGGSIISGKNYGAFALIPRTGDITFTNEVSGEYTTLTLPKESARPSEVFNSNAGKSVFTLRADLSTDTTETYEIAHFDVLDMGIKTNLVFASEMLMAIYIPEDTTGNMTSFTVDGIEYLKSGFGSLNYRMIGGVKHYVALVNLPAKEAARDISVGASTLIDGAVFDIDFTVSLIGYAKGVLGASPTTEQATLILDTLAYIKSAYTFFSCDNASTVGAAIDEVLSANEYESSFTKSEGSTTSTTGFESTTIVLEARPVIRLYIADGYESSIFRFKQGNTDIGYVTHYGEDGGVDYIDIALLAYRMPSEITYSIDGVEMGVYHINTYYEWATDQGNEALSDIAAKFYAYCQSALEYKNSLSGS